MRDHTSDRWAIAIVLVVAGLLVSMAVRADDRPLEDRVRAFVTARSDGRWRARERHWDRDLRAVTDAAEAAGRDWPSAELLVAIAWRESRLRPRAVGALGERGLTQLHPRYHRGDLWDPQTNMRIASDRLVVDLATCGEHGRALRRYATGACGAPTWAERVVMLWAEAMR